ncbi:7-carboxy-7-deazaguanine synthase [mine drainage metagenome]|uniref:7-carboxy-7-deazaguanine synthase n=1 Tax=mine drainage metagenome TaxID=410659 RepID=A0A1J5SJ36_9ZZZZ
MSYSVKELFYSLQGEGARAGRAAVFCRFSGCNLWSGREADRAAAVCDFCDTDFVGADAGKFAAAADLARAVAALWPAGAGGAPYVVCTGGEPLLQLDQALCDALHEQGFEVAVETNGTRPCPPGVDWLCVSPKADAPLALTAGDELKLVYPQAKARPERFAGLAFRHFILQPLDGPDRAAAVRAAAAYCLENPQWRLGLQMHKVVGLR